MRPSFSRLFGPILTYLQKYTVQSYGVWEGIRRVLAVDPTRSTGVPLNSQFRNPPPGANPPGSYDDPVTVPSGDIAENPYYKRDIRRSYPRPSVLTQADITGLLTVGSSAMPIEGSLQTGEAGAKQLIEIKEGRGLSEVLGDKNLSSGGLPPNPAGLHRQATEGRKGYTINKNNGFPERQVGKNETAPNRHSSVLGIPVELSAERGFVIERMARILCHHTSHTGPSYAEASSDASA